MIRAGFGMYNDLQDALGYRTDQNAPFNPTYSLPNLPVSSASDLAVCAGPGHREAGSGRSSAESEDAHADFLVVPNPAGIDGQYRAHASAMSDRTDTTKFSASTPMNPFR